MSIMYVELNRSSSNIFLYFVHNMTFPTGVTGTCINIFEGNHDCTTDLTKRTVGSCATGTKLLPFYLLYTNTEKLQVTVQLWQKCG